ncbi:MAG: hypothetical protein GXP62_17005 [Oligoflexia bacterium]|nr:hypothetical protein [Oligoflexia bacterium]
MYNLAISLGIALVAYLAGLALAGWLAGFLPAVIAAVLAYVLLARRTGRQLEALMKEAGAAFQQGKIDRGRKLLEHGFALAPWQFLVSQQIHGQLGAIDYLQRKWKPARAHLDKAWSRNWMSQAMLACLDHREGKHQEALDRMDKTTGPGGGDPTFWALYGWLALDSGDRDKAISVLGAGIKKNEASDALKAFSDAVRNKSRIKPVKQFAPFAPNWYQFFPEHVPRSQMMAAQGRHPGGYSPPQPKGFRRG